MSAATSAATSSGASAFTENDLLTEATSLTAHLKKLQEDVKATMANFEKSFKRVQDESNLCWREMEYKLKNLHTQSNRHLQRTRTDRTRELDAIARELMKLQIELGDMHTLSPTKRAKTRAALAARMEQIKTIRVRAKSLFDTEVDSPAFTTLKLAPLDGLSDFMRRDFTWYYCLRSTMTAWDFSLRLVPQDSCLSSVCMEVTTIPREEVEEGRARAVECKKIPLILLKEFDIFLDLDGEERQLFSIPDLFQCGNMVEVEEDRFRFKLDLGEERALRDVMVQVRFSSQDIMKSPQMVSVRPNKSFRIDTLPRVLLKTMGVIPEEEEEDAGAKAVTFDLCNSLGGKTAANNVSAAGDLGESDARAILMAGDGPFTVEEVCRCFKVNDVDLEYTDDDYRNLTTYELFQSRYGTRIEQANPPAAPKAMALLVEAKWREFQREQSSSGFGAAEAENADKSVSLSQPATTTTSARAAAVAVRDPVPGPSTSSSSQPPTAAQEPSLESVLLSFDPFGASFPTVPEETKERIKDRMFKAAEEHELELYEVYLADVAGVISTNRFFDRLTPDQSVRVSDKMPGGFFRSPFPPDESGRLKFVRAFSCLASAAAVHKRGAESNTQAAVDNICGLLLRRCCSDAFDLLAKCSSLDHDTIRRLYVRAMGLFVANEPYSFYLSTKKLATLRSLLVPFEAEEATTIVGRLAAREHDRDSMSAAVGAVVKEYDQGSQLILGLVNERIVRELRDWDEASFGTSLALARAACRDKHASAYGDWFHSAFGQEATSLAARTRKFGTLVQMLTKMVPEEEDRRALRAQVTKPPFLPEAHRQAWQDYTALARTRMVDLATAEEARAKAEAEKEARMQKTMASQSATSSSQSKKRKRETEGETAPDASAKAADEEVERALTEFSRDGKIPHFVSQAKKFRSEHFEKNFLPALKRKGAGGGDAPAKRFAATLVKKGVAPKGFKL